MLILAVFSILPVFLIFLLPLFNSQSLVLKYRQDEANKHEIHLYLDECGLYFSRLNTTEYMMLEIGMANGDIT